MMYLREICREDLNEINKWRNDVNLIANLGANYRYIGKEVDNKWFDNYLNNRSSNVRCAIIYENKIVGVVYLTSIDYLNGNAEFHIMIGNNEYRGKGIGYFATKEMLKHAFLNLNLNRVELSVLSSNTNAINLYTKVGFKEEGILKEKVFKQGKYVDLKIMAMLRKDFNNE